MYTIGEIAKIVNISTDTLRYYDEIGLLKPVRIDESSKYRYYSDIQVEDILLIMELKQYGFTLEEMKNLLSSKESDDIKMAFQAKLTELGVEHSNTKHMMEILQKRLNELERESGNMAAQKSVLIADDVYLVRILIKNILEKYGYKIIGEALNGMEACQKYFELKPDIVIMDIVMPVMDGIYAAKTIIEKDSSACIVMCSGMNQAIIAIESLGVGALDFICKPFTEIRLIEGVEKALTSKSSYDSLHLSKLINEVRSRNFGNVDNHKPLNQKEMDALLNLLNAKAEDIVLEKFIENIEIPEHLQSPDHWYSYRESNVSPIVLKEIGKFFQELSNSSSLYLQNKTGQSYSLGLLSVELMLLNPSFCL